MVHMDFKTIWQFICRHCYFIVSNVLTFLIILMITHQFVISSSVLKGFGCLCKRMRCPKVTDVIGLQCMATTA